MAGTPIHTLRDLLIPNNQKTRCLLCRLDETGQSGTPKTSSFSPRCIPPSNFHWRVEVARGGTAGGRKNVSRCGAVLLHYRNRRENNIYYYFLIISNLDRLG